MAENDDRKSSPPKPKGGSDEPPDSRDREFALKYYEIMLGALGSRERQVIQMFAYVAPAMAAMAWIVTTNNALLVFGGSCTLAVILAHGRQHIIRMAYNFRSCMLQTGKIEEKTGWKRYVLVKWIRRTETPPDDFLPEMFKSQVHILQLAMWAVITIGASAILGPAGKSFYFWLFEEAAWPKSNCYQLEYVILAIAVGSLIFLGVRLESRCADTLGKSESDLRETYALEKQERSSRVLANVPGDMDDVAKSG